MKEKTIFTGARSIVAQITNAIVIMAHRAPGGTYQIVGSAKVYPGAKSICPVGHF